MAGPSEELHRPRCCGTPSPEATSGLGGDDDAFITVWCRSCGTDLVKLDPPSGGDRGVYIGRWQMEPPACPHCGVPFPGDDWESCHACGWCVDQGRPEDGGVW